MYVSDTADVLKLRADKTEENYYSLHEMCIYIFRRLLSRKKRIPSLFL